MLCTFEVYGLNGDGTETLLHPEVPFSDARFTRELGVGRFTGSLPPEFLNEKAHDGRRIVAPWASGVYVSIDGVFFDAFIITDVVDEGSVVKVEGVGWLGYLSEMPYRGATVAKNNYNMWSAVSALVGSHARFEGFDSGLRPDPDNERRLRGVVLGNPPPNEIPAKLPHPGKAPVLGVKKPVAPKYPKRSTYPKRPVKGKMGKAQWAKALREYEAGRKRVTASNDKLQATYKASRAAYEKARDDYNKKKKKFDDVNRKYKEKLSKYKQREKEIARVWEGARYKLDWWSTHDCLRELQALCLDAGFFMKATSNPPGGAPGHVVSFHTVGNVNRRVQFVDGENVYVLPKLRVGGDEYATDVRVLGSGEGAKTVVADRNVRAGGRTGLGRVKTVVDKKVYTKKRAGTVADKELAHREGWLGVEQLQLVDVYQSGFGEFDVGDVVQYITLERRGLETSAWLLVESVEVEPVKELVTVSGSVVVL